MVSQRCLSRKEHFFICEGGRYLAQAVYVETGREIGMICYLRLFLFCLLRIAKKVQERHSKMISQRISCLRLFSSRLFPELASEYHGTPNKNCLPEATEHKGWGNICPLLCA